MTVKLTFHLDATFFDCILRIRCESGFNVAYRMTATAPWAMAPST